MQILTAEWVTPDCDPDVQFKIRGMNGLEKARYLAFGDVPVPGRPGQLIISKEAVEALLYAVQDWKGVFDGDKPVPFSYARLLDYPDAATIIWLVKEIRDRSFVSPDAEKN